VSVGVTEAESDAQAPAVRVVTVGVAVIAVVPVRPIVATVVVTTARMSAARVAASGMATATTRTTARDRASDGCGTAASLVPLARVGEAGGGHENGNRQRSDGREPGNHGFTCRNFVAKPVARFQAEKAWPAPARR